MPFSKEASAIVAALWIAAGFCSCSPAGGGARTPEAKSPRHIRAAIIPQPQSLIPREGDVYVEGQFTETLFSNLVQANYLGNLSPELAESWEISPDHREFTFHLRKNVRFHDGRPFTAADVVFTLEKLIEKAKDKCAEITYIDGYEEFLNKRSRSVRGIRTLDDHTLRIKLNENFKFFLQFLAAEYAAIVPRDYAGLDEAAFRKRPIGTGPFRLVRTEAKAIGPNQFLVFKLEKNRDYFAPAGNLETIDIYSANSAIDPGSKKFFDLLFVFTSEIPEFNDKPDFRVINSSPGILNFLVLNPSENSHMRERKVRQLVNYGINREDLVRKIFHNQALPAHSMIPYGLLGNNPYYRLDYSRAEKIRAELPPGKIQFTIMTVADGERELVAEFVSRELARFNLEVKVVSIADRYDYFTNRIYSTNTSIMLGGIPDYPSSYHFISHLLEPGGYYNVFRFSSPALDSKIRTLPSTSTVDEARTLAEISAALEKDSFYIPLYHNSNFIAIRERIKSIAFKYGEIVDFAALEVAE